MDIDRKLNHILRDEKPYSPPLEESYLPEKTPLPKPAKFTKIKVPTGTETLNGQLLKEGAFPLTQRKNHELLLITDKFTFVHISADGMVITKNGNEKKFQGMLVSDKSSLSLEINKPFTITTTHRREATFLLNERIKEVILYDPPQPHTRRKKSGPQTNMYTLLLRQFQV